MGTRLAGWRGVWGSVLVHLCAVATLVAAPLGGNIITSSSTGHMMVSLANLPGGAGQGTSGAPAEPSGCMSRASATRPPAQQTKQETVARPETTTPQRSQAATPSPKDIATRHDKLPEKRVDKQPEKKTEQPAPKPVPEKPTASATTPSSDTTATNTIVPVIAPAVAPADTSAHDAPAPASAGKETADASDSSAGRSGNGDDNSKGGSGGETAKAEQGGTAGQGGTSGRGGAGAATPFGYAIGDVDAPPTVCSKVPPDYPRRARRTGTEGRVVLRLLVHENGTPDHLSIVESTPPGIFDQSALDAVTRWRFAPGKRAGRAVPTWVLLPVRFDLASR